MNQNTQKCKQLNVAGALHAMSLRFEWRWFRTVMFSQVMGHIYVIDLVSVHTGADPGFGQGGAPASVAESCRRSEAESRERSEQYAAGVQGPLKGPGSFWVFNAQICILTHSRDSFSLIFDIYFDTKS